MNLLQTKKTDALFRKKLGEIEENAPEHIWNKIDAQLPRNQLFSPFTKVVIAFGLLLVSSFTAFQLFNKAHKKIIVQELKMEKNILVDKLSLEKDDVENKFSNEKKYTNNKLSSIAVNEIKKEKIENRIIAKEKIYDDINTIYPYEKINFKEENLSNIRLDESKSSILDESTFNDNTPIFSNQLESENNIIPVEVQETIIDKSAIILSESVSNEISNNLVDEIAIAEKNNNTIGIKSKQASAIQYIANKNINKMFGDMNGLMNPTAGIDEVDPLTLRRLKNNVNFDKVNLDKGFYIGPYIGVNYTWLSVSKKYQDKNYRVENVKYKISFGKTLGLSMGYDFSKHWGVAADFGLSSINQTYFERPSDGSQNTRTVKLNYIQIPTYIRYKSNLSARLDHKPIVLGAMLGPQISFLTKLKTIENGSRQDINQRINASEWGLAGIVNADFYINKSLFMTLGLKGAFGANLAEFPKIQGNDKKDPISYQFGVFTRFNFKVSPRH